MPTGGDAATAYRVEVSRNGGGFTVLAPMHSATNFRHTSVAPGENLRYRITALNAAGNAIFAPTRNAMIPAIAPGAATNVMAMPTGTNVDLTWNAPTNTGGAAVRYRIEVSNDNGATFTRLVAMNTATNFRHTGVTPGENLVYRVTAVNTAGDAATMPTVNTVIPLPPPVTVPTALIPAAGLGAKDPFFMRGGGFDVNSGTTNTILSTTAIAFPDGVVAFGKRIEGPTARVARLVVSTPPSDVRTAWHQGWTGRGVNLLIADGFGSVGSALGATHGYTVGMSAAEIAPGATYLGFEVGLNAFDSYRRGGLRDTDNDPVNVNTKIDVMNLSFGTDPIPLGSSRAEIRRILTGVSMQPVWGDLLGGDYLTNADDAVITKAAGNESADSGLVAENLLMALADETRSRVLIVGALTRYAQAGNARLASYSNRAGVLEEVQDRFLVEFGGAPYGQSAWLCDARTPSTAGCASQQSLGGEEGQGTSFAAPRVAGHAALVRHKFPGLSGPQTTKILLDTATTQGLACHPNCNVQIYGQGRVDITNALSPIGKLE